jgi:hypothetical protein
MQIARGRGAWREVTPEKLLVGRAGALTGSGPQLCSWLRVCRAFSVSTAFLEAGTCQDSIRISELHRYTRTEQYFNLNEQPDSTQSPSPHPPIETHARLSYQRLALFSTACALMAVVDTICTVYSLQEQLPSIYTYSSSARAARSRNNVGPDADQYFMSFRTNDDGGRDLAGV